MRDPGLQPERTALAWQRTALSAAVAAVLLLRSGLVRGAPLEIAAAGCAAAVVVLWFIAVRRPSTTGSARRILAAATLAVAAAGVLTAIQVVLLP
ncbi:hypothetical protein GCM10027445_09640 [Amycolatopsis endophytica]|uniref:Uncharacterized membrane protein YidH (DUF202 family) n=1 Tax=Amycolatopsis endophytica TaxID=860233 RepID=A0A853AX86_9PSEU|nr:DUF202 domain-containing protein [Amycolatopsis endophytica]NYI87201.1 uncharacterized membrane protein YidH (DUF202 family) [Amycolatopsis endophytica]